MVAPPWYRDDGWRVVVMAGRVWRVMFQEDRPVVAFGASPCRGGSARWSRWRRDNISGDPSSNEASRSKALHHGSLVMAAHGPSVIL